MMGIPDDWEFFRRGLATENATSMCAVLVASPE